MEWLSNLDTLKKIGSVTQWFAITLIFLGGLLQLSKFIIDRRISDLKEQLSIQRDESYQNTISSLRSTVQEQNDKLGTVEGQLREAQSKITTFSTRLAVRFSGNWSSKPYPNQIFSPTSHQYYVEITGDSTNKAIKFYATEPYVFKTIDAKSALFESIQAVRDGDFPLGNGIRSLEKLNIVTLHIPFVMWKEIIDQSITIQNITLTFLVNGEPRHTVSVDSQYAVPIICSGPLGWANPLLNLESKALIEWLSM